MVISTVNVKRVRHFSAPHLGAVLLLAALGLRALIPAGFMLAPVEGRAQIVLCGPSASHAAHSRGVPSGHPGHPAQVDPTCPFAQSAAPAVATAPPLIPPAPTGAIPSLRDTDALPFVPPGPARQQSPRAPPQLT
jgi:hypothetical protein